MKITTIALAAACLIGCAASARPAADAAETQAREALAMLEREAALREARKEANAVRREEEDLIAQKNMDRAAQEMVGLTRQQVTLGWASLVGLLVSLTATLISLMQTRISLRDARRTTVAQLRPYLGIKQVTADEVLGVKVLNYQFQNFGQTSAVDVRWAANAKTFEDTPRTFTIDDPADDVFIRLGSVEPGSEASFTVELLGANYTRLWDGIVSGANSVGIVIVIEYRDTFGFDHRFQQSEIRYGDDLCHSIINQGEVAQTT